MRQVARPGTQQEKEEKGEASARPASARRGRTGGRLDGQGQEAGGSDARHADGVVSGGVSGSALSPMQVLRRRCWIEHEGLGYSSPLLVMVVASFRRAGSTAGVDRSESAEAHSLSPFLEAEIAYSV